MPNLDVWPAVTAIAATMATLSHPLERGLWLALLSVLGAVLQAIALFACTC